MAEVRKFIVFIFALIVLVLILDRADKVVKIEQGTSSFIDSLITAVQAPAGVQPSANAQKAQGSKS